MIYLDTSALVKQIRAEAESAALADWLDHHRETPCIASALAEVELPRAIRGCAPGGLPSVPAVLARLNLFEIDAPVRATAASYADATLRSLDAIHLATAQIAATITPLTAFVVYDKRLAAAAKELGLPVVAPGRA